jgi:hypothetical protein
VCVYSPRYPACNDLPCSTTFFHIVSQKSLFSKKKNIDHKMCVLISSTNSVWHISYSKKKWVGYDKKCLVASMYSALYSCPTSIKLECSQQFFEKYSNVKFYENPSSRSRVVPCGRTDMTKLIVAFRNFANALKYSGLFQKDNNCNIILITYKDIVREMF